MARLLRPRHREAHVGEEAALAALADVALGLGVRLGARRADRVEPELGAESLEFRGVHPDSLPRCARCGSMRTADPRSSSSKRCPIRCPLPGEVLVRLHASALNHLDVWIRKGLPSVPKPRILGADGAGIRVDTGERVVINPGIETPTGAIHVIGEHGDGTNAELIAVPEANVHPIPGDLSFEEAAAFPLVFETAYRMLVTRARLQEGEWVFAWGIGSGVSTAALAIAKALGARVIVTSSSDAKLARARELGADLALNHATEDVKAAVKEATDGRGADVVVEHVGEATWKTVTRHRGARGPDHGVRRDDRPEPAGAAPPGLVEAALHPRLDDGNRRGLRRRLRPDRERPRAPGRRPRLPARGDPRRARADGSRRAARQDRPLDLAMRKRCGNGS